MSLNITQAHISRELFDTLEGLNKQILEVGKLAESVGCQPQELRTMQGDLMLSPLLVAKAGALTGLACLHGGK